MITATFLCGCGSPAGDAVHETESTAETADLKVVALSGSLADMWMLAGGVLLGVTDDAFDIAELPDSVKSVGSLSKPSTEAIAALDPDLVLLTSDIPAHKKLKEELEGLGYNVRAVDIESFDDYAKVMKEFTGLTGREDLYKKNCTDVKARIDDLTAGKEDAFSDVSYLCIRASATKNKALKRDSFACEIISGFGAKNIADDDEALDELSLEEIASQDPDYFFVTAMGDEEEAKESFEQTFASQGVFNELRSVKEGHLIFLPKDLFQNKPNARWDEAYKYIYELFSEE